MPTAMKVRTAYSEVTESDARPLIPCPLVHPIESLVPSPTSTPPNASHHKFMVVI